MVTNVKMEVTPELSRRVQEIVFNNGGKWISNGTKILNYSYRYLYISDNILSNEDSTTHFKKNDKFKKISPYNFIASQGQQEWLPKYDEECEFSNDGRVWFIDNFKSYTPTIDCPFSIGRFSYRYCRSIKQTKVITIDGKDIEISKESFNSLKQQLCEG